MKTICAVWLAFLFSGAVAAVDSQPTPVPAPTQAKPKTPEARKQAFQALQKELEPLRPGDGASKAEIMAYLELAMESYGKFARENPKTSEGFEAASLIALLLIRANHPHAEEFEQLAVDI